MIPEKLKQRRGKNTSINLVAADLQEKKMSRTEEVNKMTENVYKGILDQFNPSLKNFVTMGKHYERALTGVTVAAKGYFDALVKLGELASDSQGSKELGDTLFQMAEVHRQIQVQLEDVLKLFHSEMLAQLEQKLELDIKYLTSTLKKYQSERRSKSESIERCQSQLKKLRRKSQGSRHPNKYGDREMQFVELMSRRQGELDALVATGYKSALTEERRRYCFLVDRQCCVTKLLINYHSKVRELLSHKLSSWHQSCSQPTKLPERALNLLRHTAPQSPGAAGIAEAVRHTKQGSAQPEQKLSVQEVPPLLNGDSSRSQQQRSLPSSSSSHSDSGPPQGSPQAFRSVSSTAGAAGGSSRGASPQHTSTPLSVSASPLPDSRSSESPAGSTPTTSSSSTQQGSLLLATSSLSPSLIPSTMMSLSQISATSSSSQGMTLPIPHSAPHSPPLSHSAPLSRAMTPVQLLHQQVGSGGSNTLSLSHNPWLLKTGDMSATATLPLPRRPLSEMRLGGFQGSSLPRTLPLSGYTQVEAMFTHIPGASEGGAGNMGGGACLLHFLPGDHITLLISEPRDGWHYGQNERTGRKGWFPFSYTQPQHGKMDQTEGSHFLSKTNSTSTGQLDKLVSAGLPALTPESEEERSLPPQRVSTFRPRPYSMADSNKITSELTSPPSPTRPNPFAHIRLRKTFTNDRSAPIIE
ncbi:brain-specific angiogenesis inhibitor 1-associated protein 2 [Nematolebias whitei]|uniref:brain-specific angiogenesis inhibitor 1-associated protein 2 n=1 Tax=Nematolebias whitei TaxID=451745 RepID=UPI00189C0943|nr:brain-specific angiogenesis inhibitor 1-associated protein 2 [Nematolebias whitei]